MRGFPFVLVPTLSLVNMGVNGASIGNMLGQRGDDAKLGATAHAARQYHTADFSNSDPAAHKGGVAHRALLDALTQPTVLSSADTGDSAANNGTAVQGVSRRVDVGQSELAAVSEDVQNVASVVPRQVSLDAPSLTNTLAPNTISSGDGLTSVTGVDSLRRDTTVADKTAVCSKHKGSVDTRALEITKTSAADPIDISNIDGGLALRAQHARQVPAVPAPAAALPVVGPILASLPRGVEARTLELAGNALGVDQLVDAAFDNAVRELTVSPTFDGKTLLAEVNVPSGTAPGVSDIYTGLMRGGIPVVASSTSGNPVSGVIPISNVQASSLPSVAVAPTIAASPSVSPVVVLASSVPIVGSNSVSPLSIVGGSGLPIVGSDSGSNLFSIVGGSGLPLVGGGAGSNPLSSVGGPDLPVVGSNTGSNTPPSIGGLPSNVPVVGSSTVSNSPLGGVDTPSVVTTSGGPLPNLGGSANPDGSSSSFLDFFSKSVFGRQVDTDAVESDVTTTEDVANEIEDNTARGLTDMLKSFPGLGSRTVKRDATVTLDALKPSLTALFARQEDTTSTSGDSDSGDATSATADSTDDGTSSADAITETRRQTSDSAEGTVDSADDTDGTSDSTGSGDDSDSVEATASATRRQTADESSTDAAGDSTDTADSGDASEASDATTTTATRRQTTDESSEATDTGDAAGDFTDSSGAGDAMDSSDSSSVTRRQSADDASAASDSTAGEATDSGDSDTSDADASASATRRQAADEATDASDSSDASGDSTDSADADDVSDSSDAAAVTRRQTTDDTTGASDSGDAAADSTTDDSADASGSSDTSGDSLDSTDSTNAAVERRQDAADDGSSTEGDASATDGDDASSATSADGNDSTSTDGSEDATVRRRALDFKLTPSKLRNRMTMRKGKRQDSTEIADAIADAASGSAVAADATTAEESLNNLD